MNIKLIISVMTAIALLCGAAFAYPVTVTDDAGCTVTITEEPKSIVSLTPAVTEILFAVGVGDRVIGDTTYCNYPEAAKNITKIGSFTDISVEKIVTLKPDIIFANPTNRKDAVERLKSLGYNVAVIEPSSTESIYNAIEIVGKLTGAEKNASDVISKMKKETIEITEKLKNSASSPKVMHAMSENPYYVSGSNTFQDELIKLAGGTNAFADVSGWGVVTLEKIITANPDIILVDSGANMGVSGDNTLQKSFYNNIRLASVSAVKNKKVYVMDADIFDRGGPRVTQALKSLSEMIHPELFSVSPTAGTTEKPTADKPSQTQSPMPVIGILIGVCSAAVILRRK